MTPAILFDADAYALNGPRLMGRQSAGNGFLRAAVHAHAGQPIHALATSRSSAEIFRDLVLQMDAKAQPRWIPTARLDMIAERGLLYRPDGAIGVHARERLRLGPGRYSICGVTHTLSSHGPADSTVDLITAPVMPWDAVICTSRAARGFMETVLDEADAYFTWRFGQKHSVPRPELPIIPLGVHAEDFAYETGERERARKALQIGEDEVAFLFAGRLTFSAKVHPFQTYAGLERAARSSHRKLVLIHAGKAPNAAIDSLFRAAAAHWAPSVRSIFVDGGDPSAFADSWRAADVFVSLSDNIQETFGITPVEAMAAGLPVVVSDWNGYKDTVRDGVDGFRVATWAPEAGTGAHMALDFEAGVHNYDYFLSRTSTTVSVAYEDLHQRFVALAENADLRRRLGEAGRNHVRAELDWAVVYARYEALWRELAAIRTRSAADPARRLAQAPKAAPNRPDPFTAFAHFPTSRVGLSTVVRTAPAADVAAYEAQIAQPMFGPWQTAAAIVGRVLSACRDGLTVGELAERIAQPPAATIELVARLAKLEVVVLRPGQTDT